MTFTTGLVSVMMPAYNAARYIGQAIDSVLAQRYPSWELLIVDDGSTDGTAAIVRQYRDPRVRLLTKENGGESTARNMALDHSTGEFVAYLDADDAWLPHHLKATVGFLRANPQYDAVYTDGTHIDEHGTEIASLQSRRRGPFQGRLFEELVRASDVFGPPLCVVLRHEGVARRGLRYDPRIVIGPDWDFFIRYADEATFGHLAERTGLYRVHRANITAQVDPTRRAGYLAICREKAIRMASFGACTPETRAAVFYDLLLVLLQGQPARREAVIGWPEFAALPAGEQARLLRLMAVDALVRDGGDVSGWLRRARTLNPADTRARVLAMLHRISPRLCRTLVRAQAGRTRTDQDGPFADLTTADVDTRV